MIAALVIGLGFTAFLSPYIPLVKGPREKGLSDKPRSGSLRLGHLPRTGLSMPKRKHLRAVFETTDRGAGMVRVASAARYVSGPTVSRKRFFIIRREFFGGRPRFGIRFLAGARVAQPFHRRTIGNRRDHPVLFEPVAPVAEAILNDLENALPVLSDDFQPRLRAHLREIDSTETEARDQDIDSVTHFLAAQ